MNANQQITRAGIAKVVLSSLDELLAQPEIQVPEHLDESTVLMGADGILDSLALVTLIVDVEQRLEEEHDVSITLADERAMSETRSPFRSVSSLTDYICTLTEEMGQDGGA